jgi:hypothetical protein
MLKFNVDSEVSKKELSPIEKVELTYGTNIKGFSFLLTSLLSFFGFFLFLEINSFWWAFFAFILSIFSLVFAAIFRANIFFSILYLFVPISFAIYQGFGYTELFSLFLIGLSFFVIFSSVRSQFIKIIHPKFFQIVFSSLSKGFFFSAIALSILISQHSTLYDVISFAQGSDVQEMHSVAPEKIQEFCKGNENCVDILSQIFSSDNLQGNILSSLQQKDFPEAILSSLSPYASESAWIIFFIVFSVFFSFFFGFSWLLTLFLNIWYFVFTKFKFLVHIGYQEVKHDMIA